MLLISNILVLFVAFLHIYFLILEMFLWTKPFGLKVFRMSQEKAQESKVLALNQGLYNGFLAAGLIFGVFYPQQQIGYAFQLFFLLCVVIAGIVGGLSVSKNIFMIQSFPAILTIIIFYIRAFR